MEAALLATHVERAFPHTDKYGPVIEKALASVEPVEVYQEEEKTQHNIRALVNVFKKYLPQELHPYVHLGATSVDILDTAQSMRLRDAVQEVLIPQLKELLGELIRITREEADTPQIGRTHGQHAVPITFGFAMAEYVARLGKSLLELKTRAQDLRGKLAGAVGAYNATSVITEDPVAMEEEFCRRLGLQASEVSTQMVEAEHILRLTTEINTAFGIIANLADDLRHLQRSEIGEVKELFIKTQVGSSTMPQKRNPWNSEHVKSLWKAFAPRILTVFMDQISEHQRDLSNSASSRFLSDYLAGFSAAMARMTKVLRTLFVDRERLGANLSQAGDFVLAEALYILLALEGVGDAHEVVRRMTLECEESRKPLIAVLKEDSALWNKVSSRLSESAGLDPEHFFSHPELYSGQAANKARSLADKYAEILDSWK